MSSGSGKTSAGTGKNKAGATKGNKVREKYQREIGAAADEMFALFTYRIAKEIPHCTLAKFSKLKILQAPNFSEFRKRMKMDLVSLFVVPGDTFDNVTGAFPIGFHIWKTETPFQFSDKTADVYALTRKKEPEYLGVKHILNYDSRILLNDWVRKIRPKGKVEKDIVGYQVCHNNDFQNQKYINLYDEDQSKAHRMQIVITPDLLLYATVYHAVRQIPKATWLNDRDQFLNPTDAVYGDLEFQTDCLVWSIFNNAVREKDGVCNWIPFYEEEVGAPSSFNSRFMANFLNGKVKRTPLEEAGTLFSRQATDEAAQTAPMEALSTEAARVLGVGKEIWKYYMSQPGINVNASFLDIRTYFQGYKTTGAGKTMMNSTSEDGRYMDLLRNLRERQKALEAAILPKIYEYGFLID